MGPLAHRCETDPKTVIDSKTMIPAGCWEKASKSFATKNGSASTAVTTDTKSETRSVQPTETLRPFLELPTIL